MVTTAELYRNAVQARLEVLNVWSSLDDYEQGRKEILEDLLEDFKNIDKLQGVEQ